MGYVSDSETGRPGSGVMSLLAARRRHVDRLVNSGGAAGERLMGEFMSDWIKRPTGSAMKNLRGGLVLAGTPIAATSFDFIALPPLCDLDLQDPTSIARWLPEMVFIELKTSNQSRVTSSFAGFFFSLTEKELEAAEALGDRHRVVLFNAVTKATMWTSVPEILERSRSSTWQLSIQL